MPTRRSFLQSTAVAGVLSTAVGAGRPAATPAPRRKFKLKYAPHIGQFEAHGGKDPIDQLKFMADEGFTAFEDNELMDRPVALQERIGATLARLNMTMGIFVVKTGDDESMMFTSGKAENRPSFVKACEAAVDVAKRVNARWATVVPGNLNRELPIGIQTGNVIDVLRAGSEVLARNNLAMVIEPLADTPDLFLRTADQGYMICRAVASPACKILFDMFHIQQNSGNLIANMDLAWDEIGYFQIGDVPGRKWPGTGEINYQNIFGHIYHKMQESGRDFVLGMEHSPWNQHDKTTERTCIDAYIAADAFA